MEKSQKCLEYYLDSKIYNNEDVQKSIENTKKEFSNKDVEIKVFLNDWGVYVISCFFKTKEASTSKFTFKRFKNKSKVNKFNEGYTENRYGKYKQTRTYKPY